MLTVIKRSTHKARKAYRDDGFYDFKECFYNRAYKYAPNHCGGLKHPDKLPTFSELKAVAAVLNREKPWSIKPGELYEYQFNRENGSGDCWIWRMNKVLYDFACRHMETFFDNY